MSRLATYSTNLCVSILVILLVGLAVFEAIQISGTSDNGIPTDEDIQLSLEASVDFFDDLSGDFREKSNRIYNDISEAIQTDVERMALYNRLDNYDVWGVTVLRGNSKWIWKGFDLSTPSDSATIDTDADKISIANYNNVVVYLSRRTLDFNGEHYIILAAEKLYTVTDLPFAENGRSPFSSEPALRDHYPVYFNFFGNMPENAIYRTLSTAFSDSVGTVYALPNQSFNVQESNDDSLNTTSIRFAFHVAIFIVFFIMLIIWSSNKRDVTIRALVFLIIALAWPLILSINFIGLWSSMIHTMTPGIELRSIRELTLYTVNGLFILFLFIAFNNLVQLTKRKEWNSKLSRAFLLSFFFGAIQVLLISFFIQSTQTLLTNSEIPLLDLELAPNAHSFFFYISSGLFFTGVSGFAISAGYHLNLIEDGKSVLIAIITAFSFFCTYFLMDLIVNDFIIVDWMFLLSIVLLLIYLIIIHFLHLYPDLIKEMSGFRKLMIGVLIASSTIYVIIWTAMNMRLDERLLENVASFTEEGSIDTRTILYDLLADIEYEFSDVTAQDIDDNISAVQIQFQQIVQQNIRQQWSDYSFYIKLISEDNREIASYSTTVETPAWSTSFYNRDIMLRTYRGEQIRWHTNRPVIWDNLPLNLSDRFISLSRGWIPIYDQENPRDIIAWVAADVYLERADYNKPMRAVLSEMPSDAWKQSFYLAEFTGSQLTRNSMIGLYNHQPQYHMLPARELEIAQTDSINFLTNKTAHGIFREVLVNTDTRKIIKASTPFPGLDQHLFSYFRLQIVLIFFGLFCFSIFSLIGLRHFSPFGQSRKFKARLIDGLALATILFLIVLTFATQYAVGIQNEKTLERELIQNLNNLSVSLKDAALAGETEATTIQLSDLTSQFNVDVILYRNANVVESTTPQVFQQNLIPSILPFPVYDFIYNRQRSHYITTSRIGNEELLVGYQSLQNSAGETIGVIAIPTFLQSPVYNEQLLETTSYLFVVYLFIFALFIGGSVLLSGQLTKPLSLIQTGLKKISRGDMKTKVPVTSRDEIGSLANAYNNMVIQLEEAQKELVKAERESAWKEMAQQVAHEIKNPLTPMKLNLQHLQRQLESNPDKALELKPLIEKTANNIIGQIESLNKIASDFSKFAQPMQEPKEPVELAGLLESVSDLYNHEITLHLDIQIPGKSVMVHAVKDELRRVFVNLIKNAIEACDNEHAYIKILLEKNSESVLVKITDNGSGIDEEDHDKIFVPKFSTKSSGTGLGLAISKKIVEAHDGKIWFKSRKGEGTDFFVELPLN